MRWQRSSFSQAIACRVKDRIAAAGVGGFIYPSPEDRRNPVKKRNLRLRANGKGKVPHSAER